MCLQLEYGRLYAFFPAKGGEEIQLHYLTHRLFMLMILKMNLVKVCSTESMAGPIQGSRSKTFVPGHQSKMAS